MNRIVKKGHIIKETDKSYFISFSSKKCRKPQWLSKEQVKIVDKKVSEYTGFSFFYFSIPLWLWHKFIN